MTTTDRVIASVVLIASAGALAVAQSSHGQRTAPLIAYEHTVGRKPTEIWVMNADGSNWKKLRRGCCFKWSPDGSRIAFHGWQKGEWNDRSSDLTLYVMNADGTGLRQLARHSWGTGLAWSPNGRRIVFSGGVGGRGWGTSVLYVVDADGSGLTQLTPLQADNRDVEPEWSPDGSRIAFARAGEPQILTVNSDGTDLRIFTPTTDHARNPTWSPDGTRIAFQAQVDPQSYGTMWDIVVMNSDGSAPQSLTKTNRTADERPRWSPDGRQIAFQSLPSGSDSDVHSIRVDGKGHIDLTRSPKFDGHPDWSSDGKTILFTSTRDGSSDIYVMTASGREPLNLTNGRNGERNRFPAWSGRP